MYIPLDILSDDSQANQDLQLQPGEPGYQHPDGCIGFETDEEQATLPYPHSCLFYKSIYCPLGEEQVG
ncbi:MAG: hypothetical protein HY731_05150 [Candidatus Tectomicrobia bacterium]|nr:hypothetical protein [Candidatus Tectomicrobia bacterium]